MDDHLSRLETKVEEAIALIRDLRQENGRLAEQVGDLQGQLAEAHQERDRLRSQLEETQQVAAQAELFEQKRQQIETKVSGLLDKLEAMG